jgi:CheY-like chemotaxis protein
MVVKKSLLSNPDILQIDESNIIEGENGLDLVAACSKYAGEIDYIFLDVNMPMLKGNEALWALEKSNRLRNAKVIFITTEKLEDVINRREKHVVGHIKKPISFETLPNMLRSIFETIQTKEQKEIEYQQELITQSVYNYCKTSNISEDKLVVESIKKITKKFFHAEPLIEKEIIPTSQKVFAEYIKSIELDINMDVVKYTFVYDYTKEDMDNKTSSLLIVHYTLDEIKEYLADAKEIALDCSIDEMLEDYFKKFIFTLRHLGDITTKEYKKFSSDYSVDDVEHIERFLIEVLNLFKGIDYSIESSAIRQSVRSANMLRDFKNRVLNIDKNPRDAFDAFCDEYQPKYSGAKNYTMAMRDKSSTEHKHNLKLLSTFVFTHKDEAIKKALVYLQKIKTDKIEFAYRYNVFRLANELITEMKESTKVKEYFNQNLPNKRLSLRVLLEYMLENHLKSSVNFSNYKQVLEQLQKENYKVILLSNDSDDAKVIESAVRKMGSGNEFKSFAQNNILITWLKSNTPDMVFIDSNYDAAQQIPLISVLKKYDDITKSSDIIVVSDGARQLDKKLITISKAMLKKPLDSSKIEKVLSFT